MGMAMEMAMAGFRLPLLPRGRTNKFDLERLQGKAKHLDGQLGFCTWSEVRTGELVWNTQGTLGKVPIDKVLLCTDQRGREVRRGLARRRGNVQMMMGRRRLTSLTWSVPYSSTFQVTM